MITENRIDAVIKEMFDGITFTREPSGLYDPLRYMIEIGGKRVRPRLCLTAYSFFADNFNDGIGSLTPNFPDIFTGEARGLFFLSN